MITSNISSNTFFFTKSEQYTRSRGGAAGYKTAIFIPFRPLFIPFYTPLYLTIKHITYTRSPFQPFLNFTYTPSPHFFQLYTLPVTQTSPAYKKKSRTIGAALLKITTTVSCYPRGY